MWNINKMTQQKQFSVFIFLSTNIFTGSEMACKWHPMAASEPVLEHMVFT